MDSTLVTILKTIGKGTVIVLEVGAKGLHLVETGMVLVAGKIRGLVE